MTPPIELSDNLTDYQRMLAEAQALANDTGRMAVVVSSTTKGDAVVEFDAFKARQGTSIIHFARPQVRR